MPYIAEPGQDITIHCQYNDTGGSAAGVTTPVARIIRPAFNAATITVSGAGTAAVNGDYVQLGDWCAGRLTYTYAAGSRYIFWDDVAPGWYIGPTPGTVATAGYKTESMNLLGSEWAAVLGDAPVPTLAWAADTAVVAAEIAGSPFSMTPDYFDEDGWCTQFLVVPQVAFGTHLLIRYTGTCDDENPACVDEIIVQAPARPPDIETYLRVDASHGLGSWITGGAAPTVEEIEEYLASIHGETSWVTGLCTYSLSGENEVTINLTCDGVGVVNERIIVRNGEGTILAAGYTDSEPAGEFICQLDDGTYYVRYGPTSSYEYSNDYTLVVSGETEEDYTCTGLVFPECGLTLAQMKSQVITALLDVYPDRMTDSLVEKWVEQGALTLDAALKWTRDIAEITTVAETAEYALESSSRNIVAVVYDDDGVLEHQEFGEHLSRIDGGGASGTPAYWSIWGGYIYLYPVPSASDITVSAYILKAPAPLAGDDVKPALPCELHTLIVDYAMFRAYTHLSDTRSATIYYGLFKDGIASFRADVSAHRTGRTHMVDVDDL